MKIVNQNSFATAKFDGNTSLIYYEYIGLISAPLGMETLRKVMAFAEKTQVKGIVSDLSKMKGTFTGVNDFFEKEYYPHMIKHGLQCTAIIVSNDIFTKYAAKDLSKRVGNFELKIFEKFDEAEKWVLETTGAFVQSVKA